MTRRRTKKLSDAYAQNNREGEEEGRPERGGEVRRRKQCAPNAFSSLLRCACPAPEHVAGEMKTCHRCQSPFLSGAERGERERVGYQAVDLGSVVTVAAGPLLQSPPTSD